MNCDIGLSGDRAVCHYDEVDVKACLLFCYPLKIMCIFFTKTLQNFRA